MTQVAEPIETLSPEQQRALLAKLLKDKAVRPKTRPLSFSQQRLWFLDQLMPQAAFYNIPGAVVLSGRLNIAALERSIQEIVRRHESLRTTIAADNGQAVQVIAPHSSLQLTVIRLEALPESERDAAARRLAEEDARRPFDLTRGPLFRASLIESHPDEHLAVFTLHHIIADGWSVGVFLREMAALYAAFSAGKPSPLPKLALQYGDFAQWQRNYLQGKVLEDQLAFWKRTMQGVAALELPSDRARPAASNMRGASRTDVYPVELMQSLKALGHRQGATLFMTLLAGFQALLHRYSGQEDFAVGTPVSGRNRAEIEPLIGFFVNTLALRADFSDRPTFLELLSRVRKAALAAFAHQDVPFEQVVDVVQPNRDLSRSPLFQVMFSLQNAPVGTMSLAGLRLTPLDVTPGTAKFDLTLAMRETPQGLAAGLEYSTDLFNNDTAGRILSHLRTLLESAAAEPDRPVADLPMLTDRERRQLLVEWNQTAADFPQKPCLHTLFEVQAARTPDDVALVCHERQLTYRELNELANRTARHLQSLGVGPEVLVGVCVERSIDMVVGLLAILKAGGAYVPLDPAYPADRVAFMLEDAQAPLIITQASLTPRLAGQSAALVCLDADRGQFDRHSSANLPCRAAPANLAYVIYTSGSTGRPKGVAITHHSAVTFSHWSRTVFNDDELSGVLASTSICFDLSVFEIFVPLHWGGTVIVAENALQLPALPRVADVTLVNTVPSAIAELVRSGGVPPTLRVVNLAGEPLRPALVDRIYAQPGVAKVYDLYGPSEGTTYSTFTLREAGGPYHVGRGIANTQVYVLDRRLEPVPVGVPGELFVAGMGLARCYLKRPDLTAEKFIANPFAGNRGERMYRTGDLARWRPDGTLEFLGRMDHQVKIRGFRIELGEIEAVLGKQPSVKETVVLAREDQPGEKRLVAYLVPAAGRQIAVSELREALGRKLPEYMIPSAFITLDALPLTPNGKLDRRALPVPDTARPELEHTLVAPRSPIEEIVAGIWSDVLRIDRVGVHDVFFELGGHSLLATQVVARLRQAFNVELPLRRLFESPTVAGLAAAIASAGRPALPPLQPAPRDCELPLSFAQQRLWFLEQLSPGDSMYNIAGALELTGDLHIAALERSLNQMVLRHEALRTTFSSAAGKPVQVIAPFAPFPLDVIDLQHLPAAQRPAEARRLAVGMAASPFDLQRGPLLRVALLAVGPREHVLLVVMHHIISDGWSLGVFVREISALYDAFSTSSDLPAALPELPIQYADFAHWQRKWLDGELLERQLSYWRDHLANVTALELPADHPRPALETYRGAVCSAHLPQELVDSLAALGRREGATLFMTLLAGFQALLARYSGQDDIAVGSPIAGRTRMETEGLIGLFVNMLVLRGDLSGNPAFLPLLRQLRETCLGAYAHQDLPFEKLVEKLQPQRDLSRSPLFQVMFALQNAADRPTELPGGLRIRPLETARNAARFDLSVVAFESSRGLELQAEYKTDLFDVATVERMLGHWQVLLGSIAADPSQPLSRLVLLSERERRQVLHDWNDTAFDFPADACIHEMFEAQAARTPDAPAVVFAGSSWSYRELNRRADVMAHGLRRLGAGPDVLIGLSVDRSAEMVAALLGILKAGSAYVPLDPAFPRDRLDYMVEDANIRVLLTDGSSEIGPRSEASEIEVVDVRQCLLEGDDRKSKIKNQKSPSASNHLAYVIYTSGSTGRPKGVQITHRAVVNFLASMAKEPGLQAGDTLLAVTTLSFDIAGLELLLPLCVGAKVVVVDRETAADGGLLSRQLSECGATVLQATPATWRMLLEHGWAPKSGMKLLCGGEALPADLADRLLGDDVELWNMYGPTETTIWSSVSRVRRGDGIISIGRPIANTEIYVLDDNLEPVPAGVPGELYIAGDGLARGYLQRAELTAEKFLPNAFDAAAGARFYRTGDLARWRLDGTLQCLGRIDHQVKVRGFRIELGEIEAVLTQHPAVRQAVVVAREDAGDKRLVAYLVPAGAAGPPAGVVFELRAALKAKLPPYMMPSAFVLLDEMPLTPNGKVNRRALPAPERDREEADRTYVAPRNPTEEMVAAIWAEVLGLQRVGAHDGFFELGGHSLLATQAVARLRQAFNVELPLRRLFESPTVAGVAEAIVTAGRSGVPPIEAVPHVGPMPLSFAQHRLWIVDQLAQGSAFYNMPAAVRLRGALDAGFVERCLQELARRHETLRTSISTIDGQPRQIIAEVFPVPVRLADLRGLPAETREAEARRLAEDDAQRPFDLARAPLWRAILVRLADDDHVLVLTLHHIVTDAWSTGILVSELAALYQSYSLGQPSPLPALPVQYADFAVWQQQWLQGEVLDGQIAYWKRRLAGVSPLELPTDRPRPAVAEFRGAVRSFRVSAEVVASLRSLGQREGTTLFMTLLAGFQALLHRYTGQDDISVGSPIAGRTRAEVEGLIGFFVNTLVLRGDLSADPSFQDLLRQVRETALGAYAHQDVPFEKLVDELQPKRDPARSPLFQVAFALQNAPLRPAELPGGLSLEPVEVASATSKFDLSMSLAERGDGLIGSLEFRTDLFDGSTIERFLEHFQRLLAHAAADPQVCVSELPLLGEAELRQFSAWNETAAGYPLRACVHELFEAQAARTPAAVAVAAPSQYFTYDELNRRANQLARHLQALGVGPEDLVGVCLERSCDTAVAVLAVLKAGGAYVPLDPTYPQERLAYMLEDSRAKLVLTHERHLARLGQDRRRAFCLETGWEAIGVLDADNLGRQAGPDHLAYMIYTSGSTGRPKGVTIPHRGLANLAAWHQALYRVSGGDRATLLAGVGFDASVWEIWPYLTAGASLHVVEPDVLSAPSRLVDWLVEQRITLSFLPTPLAELVIAERWPSTTPLRAMLTGGDRLHRSGPPGLPFALMNHYGPTENSVVTTCCEVRPGDPALPPIGRPIGNTQVYVLDRRLQQVPVGVLGELYIGGIGLARGYLGRPDWTAERFIPDPFSGQAGERLYKTGDLVRYQPDGRIDFAGRLDHQVKIRGFRIELGEIAAVLKSHPAVRDAVVLARQDSPGEPRLVGYVVPEGRAPDDAAMPSELRAYLKEKLPDYMVPTAFVALEALPLNASGKVDRRALPAPDRPHSRPEGEYAAPRNAAEEAIARIWAEVLALPRVGVFDNFFELGGDSIMAIQVVSRANQAGLRLTPKLLFQFQTIAELATAVGTATAVQAEQGLVTGPVLLTPIQHWFFDQILPDRHHWNQAILLEAPADLDLEQLQSAAAHLLAHHDALRLRFVQEPAAAAGPGPAPRRVWRQWNDGAENAAVFSRYDLSGMNEAQRRAAVTVEAARLQASLDLGAGPLLRLAHFRFGAKEPGRLLIVCHHLAIDGVSWRILLEDLGIALSQLGQGRAVQLALKTTSFQQWSQRLHEYARSEKLLAELPFWQEVAQHAATSLPVDFPSGTNLQGESEGFSVSLTADETRALLQEVPPVYRTQITEVLLSALVQATAPWTGSTALTVHLESHGREELFDDVDLSRTVGWFTSLYPIRLDVGDARGPGQVLKHIKEQLRRIPSRGLGYGVLRYLAPAECGEKLNSGSVPQVLFNYLGQVDQALPKGARFGPARESIGSAFGPLGARPHALNINAVVGDGCLHVRWDFSRNLFRRATVERLAADFLAALRSIIEHCQSPEAGGVTPSDFPLARLDQAHLDRLVGRNRDVEDLYPLSPMQAGMLFHSLYAPESGVYVEQTCCVLETDLRLPAFRLAWEQMVERHPVFRTSVVWQDVPRPMQMVSKEASLPWDEEDWRGLAADEQRKRLADYLRDVRQHRLSLTRPPLMRVGVFRLDEHRYQLAWSHHHLLLDAWCRPVLLKEVLASYEAHCQSTRVDLPPARPYREYIAWLEQQDPSKAEAFWRKCLAGIRRPTALPLDRGQPGADACRATGQQEDYAMDGLHLEEAETAALQALARRRQLTLNTLVQGAWALLLSRYSGADDVLFGTAVAGRPPHLEGVETMLGLFINTVPVRTRVPQSATVGQWLAMLQDQQWEAREFEHSPLVQVQTWSEVPRGQPLFESLLVFEHDADRSQPGQQGITVAAQEGGMFARTNYPLTVLAGSGPRLLLGCGYDRRRFEPETIRRMLAHWRALLAAFVADVERPLSAVPLFSDAESEAVRNWRDARCEAMDHVPTVRPATYDADELCQRTNLTKNQFLIWVAEKFNPGSPVYNCPGAFDFAGPIDPQHFCTAFQAMIDQCDAFRTVFEEQDGLPQQRVLPRIPDAIPVLDFSGKADSAAAAEAWLLRRSRTPLNLAVQPFEAALLKLSDGQFIWYMNPHHIIADGWTTLLYFQYTEALYVRCRQGQTDLSLSLPQFSDFVESERRQYGGDAWKRCKAYWQNKLSDDVEAPRFYGSGAPQRGTRVERVSTAVDAARSQRLRELAAEDDFAAIGSAASLANMFAALVASFLYRLDGQRKLRLAMPFLNRNSQAAKETVGLFAQMAPLCLNISADETFPTLVRKLQEEMVAARRHRHYTTENPVQRRAYDVMFNYHVSSQATFDGMPFNSRWLYPGHEHDSLAVQVKDFNSRGVFELDFDLHCDVFAEEDRPRVVRHFLRLLEQFCDEPRQRLDSLSILSPEEERQLLVDFNDARPFPSCGATILTSLERQARLTPHEPAVLQGDQSLTYGELHQQANRLAHHLRRLGAGPDVLVGICLERSPDLIVALLAVLKSGSAYVPIDPAYPQERMAAMLAEAGAPLLVTEACLSSRLESYGGRMIRLDADRNAIAAESERPPLCEIVSTQRIYAIFTSGSTGRPKLAAVQHGGFANLLSWFIGEFAIGPADRALVVSSFTFDLTQKNFFAPLMTGGRVVLPTGAHFEPEAVRRIIADQGITLLNCTPSAFYPLVEDADERRWESLTTLRHVFLGGEPILVSRFAEWTAWHNGRTQIVNTYGPTECTDICAFYRLESPESLVGGPAPTGRTVPGTRMYVLGPDMQLLPQGAPGELYIGGQGVGDGYLNDAALAAARFLPDPFSNPPGARIYKSGDLVRWLPDGNLQYLGRTDHQVKVRGFRIELGEIEGALGRHPLVRQAVVTVREDSPGDKRLAAYVLPESEQRPSASDLRRHLQDSLPDYMIPSAFVVLETFPLSPNGKVDRKALPAPDASGSDSQYVAPRTPVEEAVAGIWAEVLGLQRVSVEANFFELGGHSLLATQVVSRLRDRFQVELPLQSLFRSPTVAATAEALAGAMGTTAPPLVPAPRTGNLPLSFAQQRLWFIDQLKSGTALYNLPAAVRLTGDLNVAAIDRCLTEVQRRHESLRTTFQAVRGQPIQVISPPSPVAAHRVDLSGLPADEREAAARRLASREARRPFDLGRGPIWRTLLLRLRADEHVLIVTTHHIASDGWSMGVLVREVAALYAAYSTGAQPRLPDLPVQYADFAVWQRDWLQGGVLEAQLDYWKQRLSGLSVLELPTDHARPPVPTGRGALLNLALSETATESLAALCREEGCTPYMTLLAAFQALLHRYSGQSDIVVGSPIAGRNRAETEGLIGFFVNTLVIRGDLSGDPTFRDLLRRVHRTALEAYQHQDVPFDRLVGEIAPDRDPSRSPLFQVSFAWQTAPDAALKLPGLTLAPVHADSGVEKFDLTLVMWERAGAYVGTISYNLDLFEKDTVARLLGHFRTLLDGIAADPDQRLSELPLLTEVERSRLTGSPAGGAPAAAVDDLSEDQLDALLGELLSEDKEKG